MLPIFTQNWVTVPRLTAYQPDVSSPLFEASCQSAMLGTNVHRYDNLGAAGLLDVFSPTYEASIKPHLYAVHIHTSHFFHRYLILLLPSTGTFFSSLKKSPNAISK